MAYIFEVEPRTGPVAGSTEVFTYGSSFNYTASYEFEFGTEGGRVAGVYVNQNKISTSSPPVDTAGYVKLAMFVNGKLYGDFVDYLYYDDPEIRSLKPACGPTSGFTQVSI
jgi:hypothetical protein